MHSVRRSEPTTAEFDQAAVYNLRQGPLSDSFFGMFLERSGTNVFYQIKLRFEEYAF